MEQAVSPASAAGRDPTAGASRSGLLHLCLQHLPAIEIREALQRIHHYLKDDGHLIYCSSDYRMAVRFDQPGFEDDQRLGVDLQREISRYFALDRELFGQDALEANPVVKSIVTGGNGALAHPALVFRKRSLDEPLFNHQWDG